MKGKTLIPGIAVLAVLLVCAAPALARSIYKAVESARAVKQADTLIVGRIVIEPPLLEGEQDLSKFSGDMGRASARQLARFKDKAFIVLDEKAMNRIQGEKDVFRRETLVPLGRTFFIRTAKRKSLHALASGLVMCGSENVRERAYLPAGYKVTIGKGDEAVYMGTIVYYRDEFMRVSKVRVKDEYDSALKDLREKFGKGFKMRKALIKVK
jgi:hypothetical protein